MAKVTLAKANCSWRSVLTWLLPSDPCNPRTEIAVDSKGATSRGRRPVGAQFPRQREEESYPDFGGRVLTTPVKLLEDGTTTSQEVVRPDHPRAGAEFSGRSQRTPAKDMMPSILRQIAEAFAGSYRKFPGTGTLSREFQSKRAGVTMAYRSGSDSAIGVASPETANSRGEWARGWKLVAVALVAYVLGAVGMFFAFGVFFKPLSSEFHWSREAVSGFTSISGVMYAVACPFWGRLADRFGMKKVILVCAVLYAVVYASQSFLTGHLWHYYAIAFLMGPAAAGTSALTFGKVISNWFDRSRGMALSVLACGSGLGGVVVPPFAQYLISHYGWREAYLLLGLSLLTVGTMPVALVLKDTPSAKAKDVPSFTAEPFDASRIPRSQVFMSQTFLTLIVVSAMIGISYVGVLTHLIPMLTDRGMTAASAAQLFSLLGVAAIAGHLVIGACFDRFPAARVAGAVLALTGLGVGAIGVARSSTALAVATVLLGASLGADTDVLPYLVSRYFNLRSYGEFLGYFFAAGTLGAAAGALLMGHVFDVYHSYILMTNIIAAASILAALLVFLLPKTTATKRT